MRSGGTASSLPSLLGALSDAALPVRIEAVRALYELKHTDSVPALVSALDDRFADIRQVAAAALARINHPDTKA